MTEMEMIWETLTRLELELEEDCSSELLEEDKGVVFDACSIDSAFFF